MYVGVCESNVTFQEQIFFFVLSQQKIQKMTFYRISLMILEIQIFFLKKIIIKWMIIFYQTMFLPFPFYIVYVNWGEYKKNRMQNEWTNKPTNCIVTSDKKKGFPTSQTKKKTPNQSTIIVIFFLSSIQSVCFLW